VLCILCIYGSKTTLRMCSTFFLVYGNNCYTYDLEFYVILTLSVLSLVRVWAGWRYKIF